MNGYTTKYLTANEKFMKTFSQAGQDIFVINTLGDLKNGLFVDIAAGDASHINNTFLLETEYDWDGLSVEIDHSHIRSWERTQRKTLLLNEDAFNINYKIEFNKLLEKNNKKEKRLNYLSLDLEPAEATFNLLKLLPLDEFIFDVITYEHDSYRFGETYKNQAREYLLDMGYELKKEDIIIPEPWARGKEKPFEDWYIYAK